MDNIVPGYKPGQSGYPKDPTTLLGAEKTNDKNKALEKQRKDFDNLLNKSYKKDTELSLGGKTKKKRNRRKMQKKHKKTQKHKKTNKK